ncbi:MAG: LysE family translocator [Pseudomonadota bacterium]
MTVFAALVFSSVVTALAAMPSASVALVVARSATLGVRNGLAATAGVVTGDLIFLAMALFGMTALAELLGGFFIAINYLAAAYLIRLGIGLVRGSREKSRVSRTFRSRSPHKGNLVRSYAVAVALTLGDIKAIFFYTSLLPTFLDLATLTAVDIIVVAAITIVCVGGVKCAYAFGASQLAVLMSERSPQKGLELTSGGLLIGTGAYLASR